jgi:cyclopropane-fatty-acyl-phospholipid synthase
MTSQPDDATTEDLQRHDLAARPGMASRLFARLARKLIRGSLAVHTPEGGTLRFEGQEKGPDAELNLKRWRPLYRLAVGGSLGFAESYLDGDWSSPDLATFLELAACNEQDVGVPDGIAPLRLVNRLLHRTRRNTRRGSRRNIAAHYDLGNEFYAQWLDPGMSYSSAIFPTGTESLEKAQDAKIERVIDQLDLRGGDSVLEIGCGWGALAEAMIRRHGCHVTGLTLSQQQLAFAQQRLAASSHNGSASLRLQDYRDVDGLFDRIVSIEMIEAVGEDNWMRYFGVLRDRLRRGGVAVLQAITIQEARFEAYRRNPDFIQRYIFPGGMLLTRSAIQSQVQRAGLVLEHAEHFATSYARTLAEWALRFETAWPRIAELGFDARFRRTWEYYLAYCQAGFRTGAIDVGLYRIAKPA